MDREQVEGKGEAMKVLKYLSLAAQFLPLFEKIEALQGGNPVSFTGLRLTWKGARYEVKGTITKAVRSSGDREDA